MAASSYNEALKRLLEHEGGYTNDPRDPGQATNFGITIFDYRKYVNPNATATDVRSMPVEVAKRIYREKYWNALLGDDLPAGVDYAIFDYGVNSGISRAAKVLQRLLGLPADGVIGPVTIAAAKKADASRLINQISDERLAFLQGLSTWDVFGNGWGRRVREVRAYAQTLASTTVLAPTVPPLLPTKSWFSTLFDAIAKLLKKPTDGRPVQPTVPQQAHDLASELVRAMRKKGYNITVGDDVVNIIYVEGMDVGGKPNNNRPNAFDSLRTLLRIHPNGTAELLGQWDATTHAGMYWEMHRMNPAGAFHIALGQQTCWIMGHYHDMEALVQDTPIMGTRDGANDFKRSGPVVRGDFGIHHHWGYDYPKDDAGQSSAGCQVGRSKAGHNEFIAFLKRDSRYQSNNGFLFTSTVLTADEVVAA